jgi:hypothetical protein
VARRCAAGFQALPVLCADGGQMAGRQERCRSAALDAEAVKSGVPRSGLRGCGYGLRGWRLRADDARSLRA